MNDTHKQDKLDVLSKRRRQVDSLNERKIKMLRLSTSENSEAIDAGHNKTSDKSDLLTSSTISLPRTHAYFISPQKQNETASYSPSKKIQIISDIKIKTADFYSYLGTEGTPIPLIEKDTNAPLFNTPSLPKHEFHFASNMPPVAMPSKLEDITAEISTRLPDAINYPETYAPLINTPSDMSLPKHEDVFAHNMPPVATPSNLEYITAEIPTQLSDTRSLSIIDDVPTTPETSKTTPSANAYFRSNSPPNTSPSIIEDVLTTASSRLIVTELGPIEMDCATKLVNTVDITACHQNAITPSNAPSTSTEHISFRVSEISEYAILTENTKSNDDEMNTDDRRSKKKIKRMCASSKKTYMEFLSDDDQDFSAGSSDLWSLNESDNSDEGSKKKVKRLKKTKKNFENNPFKNTILIEKKKKRPNKKKVLKELKDKGKSYENRNGNIKEEKKMQKNPCEEGKCLKRCFEILEAKRTSLFNHYYSMDTQRRRDWLLRCVRSIPVKRKRSTTDESRRTVTNEYFINYGEDHRAVCQKFLLATLDISQKTLRYTMDNAVNNMAKEDMRKLNVPEKYTQEIKDYVQTYIKKLPVMPSHYSRKRSNKMYLPQEFKNISNIYRKYLDDCELNKQQPVSSSLFRKIFNEYNLGIHVPKKDKCVLCTRAENNTEQITEENKEKIKEHLEEKKEMYKRFIFHQNLRSLTNDTITTSFDLQKVLNTPHGESMLLYYSRKYSVYNFTLYESTTQEVFCYTWGESEGNRGSNEIATCLLKYLQNIDSRAIKNLILYCDSCGGQNRNKNVLATLHYFLTVSRNLETIQINFLLPGHTYMPVDSVHAVIEREVKRIIVWNPSQWASYFESARKKPTPYKVMVLDHTDFIDLGDVANRTFTKTTLKNIQFKNLKIATFKKKNTGTVQIKYSMKKNAEEINVKLFQEQPKKSKGKGKGKGKGKEKSKNAQNKTAEYDAVTDYQPNFSLKPLYTTRLPISAAKYKDLIRLCDTIIPKTYQNEYRNLPSGVNVPDILAETDEEDEEENVNDES